ILGPGLLPSLDMTRVISKIRSSRTSVELVSANAELGRAGGKWRKPKSSFLSLLCFSDLSIVLVDAVAKQSCRFVRPSWLEAVSPSAVGLVFDCRVRQVEIALPRRKSGMRVAIEGGEARSVLPIWRC